VDADEESALAVVRGVGRGQLDISEVAGRLEGWGHPKSS
jgi:hypothetical protein